MTGKKTTVNDEQLLDIGLANFAQEGCAKFMAGIAEHNPDGVTPLCRLSARDILYQQKQEVIDSWFYLCAMEIKLAELEEAAG